MDSSSSFFISVLALLANSSWPPFLFALAVGVPSALLYCLLLSVIIANFQHFSSPFFVLVIIRGICSLAGYIVAFLTHRFGKIGLFLPIYLKLPQCVLAFLLFMVYYTFHVENLLTAFLLLNRLSAILVPMKCAKLWRRALPFVVAFSILLPLPFTVPIFWLDMYIHVQADNVTFTLDDHKTENAVNCAQIAAWSSVIFGIVCLLLNLATLFAYKLSKSHQNKDQEAANERKMTLYTVATFFGQLLMAIYMIIIDLSVENFLDELNNRNPILHAWFGITHDENQSLFLATFNQYPWVNDCSSVVIPAWLLLWLSTKVREIIAKKFKLVLLHRKGHVVHVTPTVQHIEILFAPKMVLTQTFKASIILYINP